jgi:hypothetical protein
MAARAGNLAPDIIECRSREQKDLLKSALIEFG